MFSGLVVVVFENHGFADVQALPSHQRLLKTGAVHTAWYDVTHPSGPNYRSLMAGDFVTQDEVIDRPVPTVADSFVKSGTGVNVVSWRGDPALRHQPFADCHAPYTMWAGENFDLFLSNDPTIHPTPPESMQQALWYVGLDDGNNAHSAPLSIADANLSKLLDQLDASPWFNTVNATTGKYPALFVCWDEVYNADEHVFAAWYGKGVKPGLYPTWRNHYSFTATVCAALGAPPLAHSAAVTAIDEVWL